MKPVMVCWLEITWCKLAQPWRKFDEDHPSVMDLWLGNGFCVSYPFHWDIEGVMTKINPNWSSIVAQYPD
jgi:hypothetical protein